MYWVLFGSHLECVTIGYQKKHFYCLQISDYCGMILSQLAIMISDIRWKFIYKMAAFETNKEKLK